MNTDLSANGTWGPSALASTIYTRSLYGQYDFMPIERVTLAAGGRVDDSTSFGSHGTYRFGGRFTAPGLKTIFRASAGTGLRAPSISDLYYPYYGNPNLKPEESLSWDAGFEQPLLENKFRFGATFFHNDFDNLIQYSGTKPENVGRARTFGVETFAAWQVLSNLTARAIYTWTDSEDLSTGQELLRRPEHNGSLNLNWQISLKLTADAKATLIGTRSDKNFNTYPAKTVDLTAYTKLDFALRWQLHKHFQIFARAENLTDERYQEAFGYPALGRGFYGGLRAQF